MTDRYLISRVLDVPKVEPANWSKWWNVWNTNARPLIKTVPNHNTGHSKWIGFDCYRHPTYNPDDHITHYNAGFFDCLELFPMLPDVISRLPIFVSNIRIMQSRSIFPPHKDYMQKNISVRAMIYDGNPASTFYYISSKSKDYQQLPGSSNTWMYYDHRTVHGSDYNPPHQKIMMSFYGIAHDTEIEVTSTYPEYDIYSRI